MLAELDEVKAGTSVEDRVGQYYNKSRISPIKCLQYQYRVYFSFAILSPRQYLSHCAILIAPNNSVACYCILLATMLYG